MNFDKLNKMIDEINTNLCIVEESAENIEKETLNKQKELFYQTVEYFANWGRLFEKVAPETGNLVIEFKPREVCKESFGIRMLVGRCISTIEFGMYYADRVQMWNYNPRYLDNEYFTNHKFKDIVIPTIEAIDFEFIEKHLVEALNEAVTKKAERIEQRYKKAAERN